MIPFLAKVKLAVPLVLLIGAVSLTGGCARVAVHQHELPPLLSQEDVTRPYDKVANIEVRRERYGYPEDLTLEDFSWGYYALREEAEKIGADAVILPEVRIVHQVFTFVPSTDMMAKGIAIKFR